MRLASHEAGGALNVGASLFGGAIIFAGGGVEPIALGIERGEI